MLLRNCFFLGIQGDGLDLFSPLALLVAMRKFNIIFFMQQ